MFCRSDRLILLILSIVFLACAGASKNNEFWPKTINNSRRQPIIIQIDQTFSATERLAIHMAMHTWEKASQDKIVFYPEWDVPKPGYFRTMTPLKENQGIFFWNLSKEKKHLTPRQFDAASRQLGVTHYGPGENSAHVVVFHGLSREQFYSVALHELGHLLNLKHIDAKYAVMSRTASSHCLTTLDAMQLCELYNCQPQPECDN